MQIEINHSNVCLAREGLVAIRDTQGTRIVCNAGSLWITQEGDLKDTVIAAGASFTVRNPGLTVVTALSDSELTIIGPGAPAQSPPWLSASRPERQRALAVLA